MLQCGGVKHTRCRSSCSSSLYLSRDETRRPVLYSCHDSAIGIRACTSTLSHALSLTHRSSSINIEQKSLRLQTRQDLLPTRVALDYVVICSSSGSATTAPTVLSSHTNNNNNNNEHAQHLEQVLKQKYRITTDWTGSLYYLKLELQGKNC
jgi:hypothetical protein